MSPSCQLTSSFQLHRRIAGKLQSLLREARAGQLPQSVLSAIAEAAELCDASPVLVEAEAKGQHMYRA